MLYSWRSPSHAFCIRWLDVFPVIDERAQAARTVGDHYFHQDREQHTLEAPQERKAGVRIDGIRVAAQPEMLSDMQRGNRIDAVIRQALQTWSVVSQGCTSSPSQRRVLES
jgi:hypothetical protein